MFLTKSYYKFEEQNKPEDNKKSTSRTFDPNNISAKK